MLSFIRPEILFSFLFLLSLYGGMILNVRLSRRQMDAGTIKKAKTILYVTFSLCFIWPFICFAVYLLAPGYEIMVGTWGTGIFFQIVFNFIAFISGVLLGVFHYRLETKHKTGDRFFLGLTVLGLAVLLFISNVVCLFLDNGDCNHSFSSPDGAHTIVVRERSLIHHVRITVYERVTPLLVCLRASGVTSNNNKPMEMNRYSVSWHEDGVTFFFDDGEESISIPFD